MSATDAIRQEFVVLAARLNSSAQARYLMAAFSRTMKVCVAGEDPFFVSIRDGAMQITPTSDVKEDLCLRIEREGRFREVLSGILDITHTLASGELVVEHGVVTDLILFNRIIMAGLKK